QFPSAPLQSLAKLYHFSKRLFPQAAIANESITFNQTVHHLSLVNISIPLNVIDHRIQQIFLTVTLSDSESANQSTITLHSINASNGFAWNGANINSDSEFTISTREFVASSASEMFQPSGNLSVQFQVKFNKSL